MKVLIDGDACPVTRIAAELCRLRGVECILFCDTAHRLELSGVRTVTVDQGADSADFAVANAVCPGDVVVTQDYGLASMCLARNARIMHQDGWEYTEYNISGLLEQRHAAKKFRAAGGRTKGPSKRTAAQNLAFSQALESLLQQTVQG